MPETRSSARVRAEPERGCEGGLELCAIPGIGPARAAALARIGLRRARELCLFVPRRLEPAARPMAIAAAREALGQVVLVRGTVGSATFRRYGRRSSLRFTLSDASGSLDVLHFNQPWQRERWTAGSERAVAGRVVATRSGPALVSPRPLEGALQEERARALAPVYPAPRGIGQELLRSLARAALEPCRAELGEPLPAAALARLGLPALFDAARELHAPRSEERFAAARRRVMLEELLALQARVFARSGRRGGQALAVELDDPAERRIRAHFPFELTAGQRQVAAEIARDLARRAPMRRLLQGDVGTGKTALGLYACMAVAGAGAQCAFLAPTELLAEQHFAGLRPLLERAGLRTALLVGSQSARERRAALAELRHGRADVAFGTHALLGAGVRFASLALAVIDEQHRFGVAQRARLVEKGRDVHLLLMTATPIPRTLALTIYADLDVSVLRERPPGRGTVRTRWLRARDRERLPLFLAERLEAGEQVYWVAPRIGEGEGAGDEGAVGDEGDAPAGAERAFRRLARSRLARFGVELAHGRLDAAERQRRLARFRAGEARILVATTLIEVGVDVPAATVMVIEEAGRLGLAQLHQLRGRVGRGGRDGWCLLFGQAAARERLLLLERTGDGFEIAEEDLRRRGMGELCGLRQSGGGPAELEGELDLLLAARELLGADPALLGRYAGPELSAGAPQVP